MRPAAGTLWRGRLGQNEPGTVADCMFAVWLLLRKGEARACSVWVYVFLLRAALDQSFALTGRRYSEGFTVFGDRAASDLNALCFQ